MKTYDSAVAAYRAAGKAHAQIDFVSFQVKDLSNPATTSWVHFCSAEDDMTVTVTDPDSGSDSSRLFLGGGHIVAMDAIVRTEGARVRSMTWTFSGVSVDVLNMVHGKNCREAVAQYFVGELDQDTGLLIARPELEFVGTIDTIEQGDGAIGMDDAVADSNVAISVVSIGADLLRINGDMRAVEVSKQRSGDTIFQYSDDSATWVTPWGKAGRSKRDREGSKPDKKPDQPGGRPNHT